MNIERSEEQQCEKKTPSLGLLLKQTRLSMGFSEEEVADRLKLRVSVVREIESMSDEHGQITTFTRGYIRSYAKLLGLDVDYLLNSNNETCKVEPVEHQLQSFSKKTSNQELDNQVMRLTWVIFAIVISMTAFWWWQNNHDDQLTTPSNTAPTLEEQDEITVFPSEIKNSEDENISIEEEEPLAVSEIEQDAFVTKTAADITEVQQDKLAESGDDISNAHPNVTADVTFATSEKGSSRPSPEVRLENTDAEGQLPTSLLSNLTLSFAADCWVEIRDANGKRMLTGIKSAGDKVELSGETPFKLVIGAPSAVTLTFKGEPIDLSGYRAKQVARFSLPN